MYMRRGSMAIVVRRASLRERQLRPHPARGAGRHRRRQPRPRRLLRRRRDHRAAADRRPSATSAHDATAFPVFNGTGANVVGLRAMLRPWQGVICAESAHLNVDEGGAPEAMGGHQAADRPDAGRQAHARAGRRAGSCGSATSTSSSPGVVSVTQSTELGTLYSLEELRALGEHARAHGMLFHIDGSRLANAAAVAGRRARRGRGGGGRRLAGRHEGRRARGRGDRRAQPGAHSVAAVPAQAVDAAGVQDALRVRAAARALRGRRVAAGRRARQRDGGAAGGRRRATR